MSYYCFNNFSATRPNFKLFFFRIVADNFDLNIKARLKTKGHANQSIHWTHQYAVEDWVQTPSTLNESQPQCNPKDLPLSQLLPDRDIQESFRRECSVLISRVLVTYYAPFKIFRDVIINYLRHPFLVSCTYILMTTLFFVAEED